jgi:membrane protease YdiL (CAAX protease family)
MSRFLSINPVRTFLLLVFVLSWPLLIYGFGWFGSRDAILTRYLFACSGMIMVAFSAFITRAFIERKGFCDVGWNLGHIRWYLGTLILFFSLWLGPPIAALLFGKLTWNQNLSRNDLTVIVLSLGGFSLLAGFGEEFGWRGYLIPRMLTKRNRSREVLVLIGLIWGIWHCAIDISPLFRSVIGGNAGWISRTAPTILRCLQSITASVALSIIFGAIWLKSRSILLSSFFHGYYVGVRDSASLVFSYPPIFRLVTLVVILIAWYTAYHWLQKYECQNDIQQAADKI